VQESEERSDGLAAEMPVSFLTMAARTAAREAAHYWDVVVVLLDSRLSFICWIARDRSANLASGERSTLMRPLVFHHRLD